MPYRSDKHRRIWRTYACGLGYVAALEAIGKAMAFIMFSLGLFFSLIVPAFSWKNRLRMALHYGRESGLLFAMAGSFCLPFLPARIVENYEAQDWHYEPLPTCCGPIRPEHVLTAVCCDTEAHVAPPSEHDSCCPPVESCMKCCNGAEPPPPSPTKSTSIVASSSFLHKEMVVADLQHSPKTSRRSRRNVNRKYGHINFVPTDPTLKDALNQVLSFDIFQNKFLTSANNGTTYIWNLETFDCIASFSKSCLKCIWSPDGTHFAAATAGTMSSILSIVELSSGVDVLQVTIPKFRAADQLSWSRDGNFIASTGEAMVDGRITTGTTIVDLKAGKILYSIPPLDSRHDMLSLAWSYALEDLLAIGRADGAVVFFQLSTGSAVKEIRCSTQKIWSLSWSPHSTDRLAIGCGDGVVRIYDAGKESFTSEFKGLRMNVWFVAWSRYNINQIAFFDGSVRVCDITTGAEFFEIPSASLNTARAVMWSVKENDLVVAEARGVRIIKLETGGVERQSMMFAEGVTGVIDEQPKSLASTSRLLSVVEHSPLPSPLAPRNPPSSVAENSPGLTRKESSSPYRQQRTSRSSIKEKDKERILKMRRREFRPHQKVSWTSDGRFVVVQGEGADSDDPSKDHVMLVGVYVADSGEKLCQLLSSERIEGVTIAVSFGSEPTIATTSSNGIIKLFDSTTGVNVGSLETSRKHIWSMAFSPVSIPLLACGDAEGLVYIFDVQSESLVVKIAVSKRPIWDLSWSPHNGDTIAALDGNLYFLSLQRGEVVREITNATEDPSLAVAWTASEAFLIKSFDSGDVDSIQLQGIGGSVTWKRRASLKAPTTTFPGQATDDEVSPGNSAPNSRPTSPNRSNTTTSFPANNVVLTSSMKRRASAPSPPMGRNSMPTTPESRTKARTRSPLTASLSASKLAAAEQNALNLAVPESSLPERALRTSPVTTEGPATTHPSAAVSDMSSVSPASSQRSSTTHDQILAEQAFAEFRISDDSESVSSSTVLPASHTFTVGKFERRSSLDKVRLMQPIQETSYSPELAMPKSRRQSEDVFVTLSVDDQGKISPLMMPATPTQKTSPTHSPPQSPSHSRSLNVNTTPYVSMASNHSTPPASKKASRSSLENVMQAKPSSRTNSPLSRGADSPRLAVPRQSASPQLFAPRQLSLPQLQVPAGGESPNRVYKSLSAEPDDYSSPVVLRQQTSGRLGVHDQQFKMPGSPRGSREFVADLVESMIQANNAPNSPKPARPLVMSLADASSGSNVADFGRSTSNDEQSYSPKAGTQFKPTQGSPKPSAGSPLPKSPLGSNPNILASFVRSAPNITSDVQAPVNTPQYSPSKLMSSGHDLVMGSNSNLIEPANTSKQQFRRGSLPVAVGVSDFQTRKASPKITLAWDVSSESGRDRDRERDETSSPYAIAPHLTDIGKPRSPMLPPKAGLMVPISKLSAHASDVQSIEILNSEAVSTFTAGDSDDESLSSNARVEFI